MNSQTVLERAVDDLIAGYDAAKVDIGCLAYRAQHAVLDHVGDASRAVHNFCMPNPVYAYVAGEVQQAGDRLSRYTAIWGAAGKAAKAIPGEIIRQHTRVPIWRTLKTHGTHTKLEHFVTDEFWEKIANHPEFNLPNVSTLSAQIISLPLGGYFLDYLRNGFTGAEIAFNRATMACVTELTMGTFQRTRALGYHASERVYSALIPGRQQISERMGKHPATTWLRDGPLQLVADYPADLFAAMITFATGYVAASMATDFLTAQQFTADYLALIYNVAKDLLWLTPIFNILNDAGIRFSGAQTPRELLNAEREANNGMTSSPISQKQGVVRTPESTAF